MSKQRSILVLIVLVILTTAFSIETDSTRTHTLQPLLLPPQYNAAYALGLYEGGHINVTGKMISGFLLGTTMNVVGIGVVSLLYDEVQPTTIPLNVNQIDYMRGFNETASLKSKKAAKQGASLAAHLELYLLGTWFMGTMIAGLAPRD